MPISCHFRKCKALLATSPSHVGSAIASTGLYLWLFYQLIRKKVTWRQCEMHRIRYCVDVFCAILRVCRVEQTNIWCVTTVYQWTRPISTSQKRRPYYSLFFACFMRPSYLAHYASCTTVCLSVRLSVSYDCLLASNFELFWAGGTNVTDKQTEHVSQ